MGDDSAGVWITSVIYYGRKSGFDFRSEPNILRKLLFKFRREALQFFLKRFVIFFQFLGPYVTSGGKHVSVLFDLIRAGILAEA